MTGRLYQRRLVTNVDLVDYFGIRMDVRSFRNCMKRQQYVILQSDRTAVLPLYGPAEGGAQGKAVFTD